MSSHYFATVFRHVMLTLRFSPLRYASELFAFFFAAISLDITPRCCCRCFLRFSMLFAELLIRFRQLIFAICCAAAIINDAFVLF